ncbi:unnamed protein product [Clonostachys solani]|uniref:ATP-binding cassette transporter abc4 n=1 Tax=Clonostachys solani TaxID=160281 RepID=A0A9N9Z4Q5_9HYPO|nr:unnamed protein product [Clonostachys solani]
MGLISPEIWLDSATGSSDQQVVQMQSSLGPGLSTIPWILQVSQIALSGLPQTIILGVSVTLTIFNILWRHRRGDPSIRPKSRASKIGWPFELASQAARAASVAFCAVSLARGYVHWPSLAALTYGLVLGLLRLIGDIGWRHLALHQVNFVFTAVFFLHLAAYFLPCVEIGSSYSSDSSVIAGTLALGVTTCIAVVTPREWVPPSLERDISTQPIDEEPSLEEKCSWFNYYCTYEWLTPLVWKGVQRKLDMSSIPRLAWYDEPLYLLRKVQDARSISKKTIWTALRFQRSELCLMALWIGLSYVAENIAPYAMFKLLAFLASPDDAQYQPWVWLSLLFIGPMSRSILFQQYVFNSTRLVVRVKSAMTQELYYKSLESMEMEEDPFDIQKQKRSDTNNNGQAEEGKQKNSTTSAGRLANLMAADVDAIFRARDFIMVSVGIPAGTIISSVGMYRMMGWPSLVGIVVLVFAIPISVVLGRMTYSTQARVRKAQDTRISLVTEYLASIRAIKYFAWEDAITQKVIESRAKEQKQLWNVAVLQAIINQVTQIFPYLSLLVMFGLHVGLEKKRLDASVAFTTVFLVKNIRRNIMQGSYFARNFAAAMVAFGRLDRYFESNVPLEKYPIGPLRIEKGCFRRNRKALFSLEDISLDFVQGGLNTIVGPSGSGKTTLLLAILGETYLEGGRITRPDDVAFSSQSSWLRNDTIKSNVLFGSPLEKPRYDRVIDACCLEDDFIELYDGDLTTVGENGTSLSGGQKARVALARALYSKAPLLLLDDVFAALDAKTAARVWERCFCGDLLKGRTVVLVTQIPWIASQSDLAVTMDKGKVKSAEVNIGVVQKPITAAEVQDIDDEAPENELQTPPELDLQPSDGPMSGAAVKVSEDTSSKDIVNQEMKASGSIGRLTFLQYMSYFGHPLLAGMCFFFLLICNIVTFYSTFWLSVWVEAYNHKAHVDIAYYLGIFALLIFLEVGSYAVVIIVFEWGAWMAARRLHNDFIRAIMRVSLSWFRAIPIGRITNRFSGDMASIDGQISNILRLTLDSVVQLIFRIAAVSSIMPIFVLPALFTCMFGVVVGEMYTRTAVVIKRLTSSAQSPVFSQFSDTLAGLPVIRARAGMSQAFVEELAAKIRVWTASAEANFNCNRWVAVRIDFVTALVALCAGIIAVSKVGTVGAGLVGFSLSNASGLSQTILTIVRAMNDLEVEMQSFHRVSEFVKLEPEGKNDETYAEEGACADEGEHVIPKAWPSSGDIEFRDVTIRYSPDGPDILKNVNLRFKAGERVAVIGRTGSGKSTLMLSLLRFTHIVSGQILYDGIDITKVPRRRLREGLTIIPQEAVLFNGSVETNLDPTGKVPRDVLSHALDNCKGIASFSDDDSDDPDSRHEDASVKLSTEVVARGENFSHGQRQVLSLCRALIRRSKLMLLDEATASMDYETDRGIQSVLRSELAAAGGDSTLVTIAHRLRTIIDYDTVVVMSAGRVVELGPPKSLYKTKGYFYDMVYNSGEMEELHEVLEGQNEL